MKRLQLTTETEAFYVEEAQRAAGYNARLIDVRLDGNRRLVALVSTVGEAERIAALLNAALANVKSARHLLEADYDAREEWRRNTRGAA